MQLRLTTRQDLATPLFRYRVIVGFLVVLGGYVFSSFFPSLSFGGLLLLFFFFLPVDDYPIDLFGALMGPMLIAVASGPGLHQYTLGFNVGVGVVASLVTGTMGFFISRWSARELNRHEAKARDNKLGS